MALLMRVSVNECTVEPMLANFFFRCIHLRWMNHHAHVYVLLEDVQVAHDDLSNCNLYQSDDKRTLSDSFLNWH